MRRAQQIHYHQQQAVAGSSQGSPAMTVSGAGQPITNGSAASLTNDTHFGNRELGVVDTNTFTISNLLGTAALTVSNITVPSQYTRLNVSLPLTVPAGESRTFDIRFDAAFNSAGYSGTVTITSTDPTTPSFTFTIDAKLWMLYADFASSRNATIGTLTYTETSGSFTQSGSQIDFTTGAGLGTLSFRSQQLTRPTDAAVVAVGTVRRTTNNELLWAFYPTTTIDNSPRFGVRLNTTTAAARLAAATLGVQAGSLTVNVDFPMAVVWEDTHYQGFVKISGVWNRIFRFTATDASMYFGFANNNAVGLIREIFIKPVALSIFAPAISIAAPVVGALTNAPTGDIWGESIAVTVPSSGSIRFAFRKQDANNYWQIEVTSAGAYEVDEVVAGVITNRIANTITTGQNLYLRAYAATIQIYKATTAIAAYSSATNFQTELGLEIISLGTGGALNNLAVASLAANTDENSALELALAG